MEIILHRTIHPDLYKVLLPIIYEYFHIVYKSYMTPTVKLK